MEKGVCRWALSLMEKQKIACGHCTEERSGQTQSLKEYWWGSKGWSGKWVSSNSQTVPSFPERYVCGGAPDLESHLKWPGILSIGFRLIRGSSTSCSPKCWWLLSHLTLCPKKLAVYFDPLPVKIRQGNPWSHSWTRKVLTLTILSGRLITLNTKTIFLLGLKTIPAS